MYAPFHDHVKDFWSLKDEGNVLFLTYEEMTKDMKTTIRTTAEFLGKTLSDEQIETLEEYLLNETNVESSNSTENNTNDSKKELNGSNYRSFVEEMSEETINSFDEWTSKELNDCSFKFDL